MSVGGRLLQVLAFALFLWCGFLQRALVAPAIAPIATTSTSSTEAEPIFSSQETVESGYPTASEPPRVTDPNVTDGLIGRLVLPVYPAGVPQRSQSKLLQPVWKQMGESCLVASRQDKATLTKPEEEGERKEAASTSGGQFGKEPHIRDLGTFWSWRPTDSEPLDCVYSHPDNEEYASTGRQTARRRNNCHDDGSAREQGEQREGESRGQAGKQGGAVEEDLGRQGCGGHRDHGTADSLGDSVQRTGSTRSDSQNTEPVTTGRETIRGFSQPAPRTRRTLEEMEPKHSEEGDRARRPLQGTEESFVCQDQRAEGEAPWTTQRTTSCSSTTKRHQGGGTGPYRGHAHSSLRGGLRHYDQQQRRRGEAQQDSVREPITVPSSVGEPSQSSEDELKEARFEENVSIRIFSQQNTQNCYEFEALMRDIENWDSKPWALYEGDFVTRSGHLFSKVCRLHNALHHCGPDGDLLHHPDAERPGEGGHSGVHAVQAYANAEDDRNDKDDEEVDAPKDRQSLQDHELLCPGIIHLFGMNGAYLGQREEYQQRHNFAPDAIWEAIERLWGEEVGADTTYHVPQPQPSRTTDYDDLVHLYVIVDFLPLHDPLHQGRLAVLCDIKGWDSDKVAMQRLEGAMLPEYATWIHIVRDIGLQEECVHRVGNQCIIRLGMRLILNDEPYVLADDDLISINFDLLEEHVDRITLLQKSAVIRSMDNEVTIPSGQQAPERMRSGQANGGGDRDPGDALDAAYRQIQRIRFNEDEDLMNEPEGQYAHLYHRTRDYVNALLDAGDPFEERRTIARIWNIEEQEVLAIHPVLHPPEDLHGRVLITRWRMDNQYRVFDTDVQILIDVELHSGDNLQPAVQLYRHVEWSRNIMARTDILAMTYVRDYCRLFAADACLVWINHQLWPIQDVALRQIRAGDFVRVAVPAQPRQTAEALRALLQHAEQCARNHLHYYPHSDAPTDDQEESEESAPTRYGRSPSQSEPEPLDKVPSEDQYEVDPETAWNFENIIGGWGLARFTVDLFFLFGGAHGHLSFETLAPFKWGSIWEAVQIHFGYAKNLIHYHIIFHPVIGGLERWSGRCRIVVEFSHIAVRPLRTRRVPALLCYSRPDLGSNVENFAWEAIYVPKSAGSFDCWKQAAPLRIWHEGNSTGHSVPGMLLLGYCRTAPAGDQIPFNALQEIGSTMIDLHYFAVAHDGKALGRRTCQLPRWQVRTKDQLLTCGSKIWPELCDPQLLIAANPIESGLAIMLYHQVCSSHRAFWCSITLEANTQETTHFCFAVRTPWPCTLPELRGCLGLQSPQVDAILAGDTL